MGGRLGRRPKSPSKTPSYVSHTQNLEEIAKILFFAIKGWPPGSRNQGGEGWGRWMQGCFGLRLVELLTLETMRLYNLLNVVI